jgi:hypothetical protein
MPPPTRANTATTATPMPKVSMVSEMTSGVALKAYFSSIYHTVISSMAKPFTIKPMTLPEAKDTRRALLRLSLAAWAVRELALVETFMPMKPHRAVRPPPVMKAKGVKGLINPFSGM